MMMMVQYEKNAYWTHFHFWGHLCLLAFCKTSTSAMASHGAMRTLCNRLRSYMPRPGHAFAPLRANCLWILWSLVLLVPMVRGDDPQAGASGQSGPASLK